MYPADGLAGDLPAPRMGPSMPPLVPSLMPGHLLPEPTAVVSLAEMPQVPGTDLVVPMGVSEGDSNIVQQLADMRLESQTAQAALPQRHSEPPALHRSSRATPRASRLLVPRRPRIVTGFGDERVDDVAADEVRRSDEGIRRARHRREEGERGRTRDLHNNDLDRAAGGAWQAGRRR